MNKITGEISEWNKLIDIEPRQNEIIIVVYLRDNKWKVGFNVYLKPRNSYIIELGEETYWVYTDGMTFNVNFPYENINDEEDGRPTSPRE